MPTRIDILFQKFIDGACSKQEYDELMDLLQQNQHEEKVRAMLSHVYQHTARSLPSGIYVDNTGSLQDTGGSTGLEIEQPLRQKRQWIRWAVAAVIILAAGLWGGLRHQKPAPEKHLPAESSVKKFTQRSERKYLLLPDSTQVWMNVASTLEYPETFEGNTREIYLTGEAYFDVRHVRNMSFIIHTGNVTTRVLGTAVNVKAYPDQTNVVVTVKRGKVQVSKNNKVIATLAMGQRVKVGTVAAKTAVMAANEKKVADWTVGQLSFDSVPFADILKDLERNYNVSIELENQSAADDVVTTSFRRDIGVEQALDILCEATKLVLRKEEGVYIISIK